MSTSGRRLLSSLVKSGDVQEFLRLGIGPHLFKESEGLLYELIHGHLSAFGVIPNKSTIENMDGFEDALVDAPEPPAYSMKEVESRYMHTSLKNMVAQAHSLLSDKNPEKALETLLTAVADLNKHKHRNSLFDFRDSAETIYNEYISQWNDNSKSNLHFGWPTLDEMTNGLRGGDLCTFVGRPACLSGETKIWVSRKKDSSGRSYTLKQLYERFNGGGIPSGRKGNRVRYWDATIPTMVNSLKEDGYIALNEVLSVVYSGKKITYTLITETGKEIRATKDHKFRMEDGSFRPLSKLKVGDKVVCRTNKQPPPKLQSVARKTKEVCGKYPYSPYRTREIAGKLYQRIALPRLVFDAALNGMHPDQFLHELKHNPNHGLLFSNLDWHIHHKDGDWANNSITNLECLPEYEHHRLHDSKSAYVRRFGKSEVRVERIDSIMEYGVEDTYDISMNYPDNNFVANDFVVHNSGKTFLLLYNAHNAWSRDRVPLFVSMEMKNIIIEQRLAAMHSHKPLKYLLRAEMTKAAMEAMMLELNFAKEKSNPFWIVDGNLTTTIDDIIMLARQLNPSVVLVDGAYLLRHPNPKVSKWDRLTDNAEWLKQRVATDLDIPVVCSYQLSREAAKKAKKNGEVSGLEDIYGTDAIGQLSTMVMGLFEDDSPETLVRRKVEILKGRNGETGQFYINWDFMKMDFHEWSEEEETADLQFMG